MTFGEIVFVGSSLLFLTVLVLDLAGVTHRGTGFRVQAAGLLIMNTAEAVSLLADFHSRGVFLVLLAGFAILLAGVVIAIRDHRAARQK